MLHVAILAYVLALLREAYSISTGGEATGGSVRMELICLTRTIQPLLLNAMVRLAAMGQEHEQKNHSFEQERNPRLFHSSV
jgi:hypothetical protein